MSATQKRELCVVCLSKPPHHSSSPYCDSCGKHVAEIRIKAIREVRRAIKLGKLAHPKLCNCADCGAKAIEYDHRDYLKPVDVEPVCRRCNQLRGPAETRLAA